MAATMHDVIAETDSRRLLLVPDTDCPDPREEWGAEDGSPDVVAWTEGDVWGYVIEERATWQRVDAMAKQGAGEAELRRMQTWETVESVWGFIGREYAEEQAREAFNA